MLILFETAAGYALFRLTDESALESPTTLYKTLRDSSKRSALLQLHKFKAFDDLENAAEAVRCLQNGTELHSSLSKFIKKAVVKHGGGDSLAVIDPKLGGLIKDKFGDLEIVSNSRVIDLQRCVREYANELLTELTESEATAMQLGLAHSCARHRLQFSADKVDTMIVQSIGLLDELDKEINVYAMRVKEWYGWHFPEMVKVLADNVKYSRVIALAGFRQDIPTTDLSSILEEEEESNVKNMAKISMGSDITDEDLKNIRFLIDQVLGLAEYRQELYDYLKNRMLAIAPTLTMMVGELVGARLLAHAGSLISLAKYPASTVQILGAEKALFRALKASKDTPKYGLIYHASFVTAATAQNKARVARSLACKTALASRIDAFTESARAGDDGSSKQTVSQASVIAAPEYLERMQKRLNKLEGRVVAVKSKTLGGVLLSKHEDSAAIGAEGKGLYDSGKDVMLKSSKKRKLAAMEDETADADASEPSSKRAKKSKKKKSDDSDDESGDDEAERKRKKKEKKAKRKAEKESAKKEKKKKSKK
jgi:nucleolar protein 58